MSRDRSGLSKISFNMPVNPHELALYFSMALPRNSPVYRADEPFVGDEEGPKLIFRWHRLDELERTLLYPAFLRKALTSLPEVTEHIVHIDDKE